MSEQHLSPEGTAGWIDKIIRFSLENKLVVALFIVVMIIWGVMTAPFDWNITAIPRDPVPVDAIPDIGENQQIVFTRWPGRSPRDVEDQITYPLTVSLLGIPGVKTIRSYSMFGFSTVYVIFKEDVEFYWSRSRILEKLNSLPPGTVPDGITPALGPDATALGQVFWYTLEGRDPEGNPTGGWDLHELRTIQDWYVRYALMSAEGVSETASVGGFVQEYQIDVNPDAMRNFDVGIEDVVMAVKMSNLDVGARTIEVNKVEYVIRGVGFIENPDDIRSSVVKVRDNVPVYVKDVAHVTLGPAQRRGVLDKEGAEAVGGVVVVRYGENPLAVIQNVKEKIKEISPGLPEKVLSDGTTSKVTIVPFYDRTGLIHETLGTLETALIDEILVTIIVIIIMVMHLRNSMLVSSLLPMAVLMCFIAMKIFGVDANIVALSGIAIAIGTMVDMGVVVSENILKHLDEALPGEDSLEVIFRGASEVGSAVVTAVATTVISFLPVFTMEAAEGKLFKPLAYTKTFALIASIIVAITIIPPAAHILLAGKIRSKTLRRILNAGLVIIGLAIAATVKWWAGLIIILIGIYRLTDKLIPERFRRRVNYGANCFAVLIVAVLLAKHWLPLGPERGFAGNFLFVGLIIGFFLTLVLLFQKFYGGILSWCLDHKALFISVPLIIVLLGGMIWLGFDTIFGWLPNKIKSRGPVSAVAHAFPGLGKEFMPPLDEGSFLWMPTTMPHASIGEVQDVLRKQDIAMSNIPEVDSVVGKLGRVESPLDPAPVSMIETVITYKPEFILDDHGRRQAFRYDPGGEDYFRNETGEKLPAPDGEPYIVEGKFPRDEKGRLIPDEDGIPFRLWRKPLDPGLNEGREAWDGIRDPDDIWDAVARAGEIPGTTSAPKLQPIMARIVMLQSGMRAPMGIKVKGPDLETIEEMGMRLEALLKEVPAIQSNTVIADRVVGKPYLEIVPDRNAIARYGIMLNTVQNVIETAVGGKAVTRTVEGRERYPVRVRYLRELRDSIEALEKIIIPAPDGTQIPLDQVADIRYVRGPQVIKSEDTFPVSYVIFDKRDGYAEVDVVNQAREYLQSKIDGGELRVPSGVSYKFAGSYENQVRAAKKLAVVLPLALFIIFLILYFQFRSALTTGLVFSGIIVAWAGGFMLIWLYGQDWFLNFSLFGVDMRDLFGIGPVNLSVAIWVGFLALFGIASDDGVIMATYLRQTFGRHKPGTGEGIKKATIEAGKRRVRPCLMTVATTVLALIPVLTSTGKGSDIMVPMAIPTVGGMLIVIITMFVVPVLYCLIEEIKLKRRE